MYNHNGGAIMAKEKLDTQIRREQIAEAALGLVASQGVRRLNIAAVARRVGLVPSGIYRHFKSKDEVLEAVLDLLGRRLLENVRAARQESADALECLHGVLMRHIRFIREGRAIPQMIFSDDLLSGHPQLREHIVGILEMYRGQLREIVCEGQRQACIRNDVDAETAALMLLGMVIPAGVLWHLTDGGFDVTRHANRAWPMFRAAIATADGKNSK